MSTSVLAVLLCLCAFPVLAKITVTDDKGTDITVEKPAERVISLAPHITEQVYAAGAGDTLVAVSSYSTYPPQAKQLPVVGDAFRVDMEQVLALKPDLILAWASGTPTAAIEQMRALGLKVVVFEPRDLQDIAGNIAKIGRLTGNQQAAQQAAKQFFKELAKLRDQYAGTKPVRVFFEISSRPLFTVNGDHVISDAIKLCGGINIFAELNTLAPAVSVESVLARDPQVIIGTGKGKQATRDMLRWLRWKNLSATKATNLFLIPPNLISRSTPRILQGIKMICEDLQEARGRLTLDNAN